MIEAVILPDERTRREVEALAGDFEPAWHTALNHDAERPAWFLARAGGQVVGFLSVFAPLAETAEVSAYVAPDYRRQGLFSALLADARRLWPGDRRWLLVVDRARPEGISVAQRRGRLAFTESTLAMPLAAKPEFPGLPQGLTLAEAHLEDVEDALGVLDRANHDDYGTHREFLQRVVEDPARRLAVLRENDRVVGVGGLHLEEETGLFAFAVDPPYQGRGWGRALLLALLDLGAPQGRDFVLDVDSTNGRAEALYRSVGFADRKVTDYYEIE